MPLLQRGLRALPQRKGRAQHRASRLGEPDRLAPLGASGTRLMATLVDALRARGGRYGLQTMCEAGGQANVTIIEALWPAAENRFG